MNAWHSNIAALFGLGAPELVIIMVLVGLVPAPLALIIWALVRTKKPAAAGISNTTHKRCADCAEFVLIDARVCKHCGLRFGETVQKG